MTFSLLLPSITAAIAGLTISGITIKDTDGITASWISTPNVLYPNPNDEGFITNFSIIYDSILEGAAAPQTVLYTLNYRFLGTQVGDLSTFPVAYDDVITKLNSIMNALVAVPTPYSGRVDMKVGNVSIGNKLDPVGNQYHGADFSLNIQELQN